MTHKLKLNAFNNNTDQTQKRFKEAKLLLFDEYGKRKKEQQLNHQLMTTEFHFGNLTTKLRERNKSRKKINESIPLSPRCHLLAKGSPFV